jgi:hypothetical protein
MKKTQITLVPPGFAPSRWLRPMLRAAQFTALAFVAIAATVSPSTSLGADKKPNILVMWGDDIGIAQDPYERADITSNTFWDLQLNHVPVVYGAIDEVGKFAATFKDFPPRSIPPSFSAYTNMEETIDAIREAKKKAGGK